MFCEKCGKENPSGARFCEGCGAAMPADPMAAPAAEAVPAAPESANIFVTIKNFFVKLWSLICANPVVKKIVLIAGPITLVLIVLLILLLCGAFTPGYKSAAVKYIKADFAFDAKTACSIQYDKYEIENNDIDIKDIIEDAKDDKDDYKEWLEDTYGKGAKIKDLEITKTKEYKKDDVKAVAEYFEDHRDYPENAIKGVAIVEYKYRIRGRDDSAKREGAYVMIKVDGKWTIGYYAGDFSDAKNVVEGWID